MIRLSTPTVATRRFSLWTKLLWLSMKIDSPTVRLFCASAGTSAATAPQEPMSLQSKRAGTTTTLSERSINA
ncbi:hypothetical protein D3C85_1626010 [compost metagenome]